MNHFLKNNQGSALVLVLIMVTVLTIVCSVVMMGIFMQHKFIRRNIHKLQALYLAEAGIHKAIWYLSGNEGRGPFWRAENETVELLDDQTCLISVNEWGGFLEVNSTVNYKHANKSIRVILGEIPPKPFEQAVYIGGVSYPLVVSGKNSIVGDVTVGMKGVEKGWIQGKGFLGDKLVDGKIIRVQNPEMPYFNNRLFERSLDEYRKTLQNPSEYEIFEDNIVPDREFLNKAVENKIYINGDLEINRQNINKKYIFIGCSGNIIIKGDTRINGPVKIAAAGKILIQDNVRIENSILYSDEGIEVAGQCQIEGQLFSSGDIIIKDQAVLDYASIVYCCARLVDNKLSGRIILQDQTTVRGTVIMYPEIRNKKYKRDDTLIHVGKNAKLVGVLYSNNQTVLEGTVYGSVVTREFFLYVSPTTYLNWLLDATIDRTKLPDIYLMALFFSERPKLDVLHWEEIRTH